MRGFAEADQAQGEGLANEGIYGARLERVKDEISVDLPAGRQEFTSCPSLVKPE